MPTLIVKRFPLQMKVPVPSPGFSSVLDSHIRRLRIKRPKDVKNIPLVSGRAKTAFSKFLQENKTFQTSKKFANAAITSGLVSSGLFAVTYSPAVASAEALLVGAFAFAARRRDVKIIRSTMKKLGAALPVEYKRNKRLRGIISAAQSRGFKFFIPTKTGLAISPDKGKYGIAFEEIISKSERLRYAPKN